jgi:VCBS repeat protein
MFRSTRVSSLASSSTLLLTLTSFLLAALASGFAQVSAPEVTTLKFTQQDLPLGQLSYGNGGSTSIITGDFNNDGILDVVTIGAIPSGDVASFFKGLGGGKLSTTPVNSSINVSNETGINGPAFGADLNGDGKLDLVIASGPICCGQSGPVTILLGNGDGTFTTGVSITVNTATGTGQAAAIALADFNGDHIPDIAVSDGVDGYTWIYLGNGDGTFKLGDTQKFGGNSLVAGDFNADGKQDVAYASGYESGGDTVGMFLGNGNGTLNVPLVVTGNYNSGLAVGDFYNNRIQSLALLYSVGPQDGNDTTYVEALRYSNGQLEVGPSTQVTQPVAEGPVNIYGGDLNGDFVDDVFISGGGYYGGPYSEYMIGNGNGNFQAPQNAPYDKQGTTFSYPIIRDLNLDSRHDVSMAWLNVEDSNGGGDVLMNDNATPNCAPPPANSLSVHICAPKNGATISKTYTFKGAGNAFSGIAKRMELWIDGKKVGQNLEDQLHVTTTLESGKHTASFVVVDSFDRYTSKSVTFTTE